MAIVPGIIFLHCRQGTCTCRYASDDSIKTVFQGGYLGWCQHGVFNKVIYNFVCLNTVRKWDAKQPTQQKSSSK